MKDHERATDCPHCGKHNELALSVSGDAAPDAGDAALCIDCGHWGVYREDGTLRQPTHEEMAEFGRNRDMVATQIAWWQAVGRKEDKGEAR